MKRTFKLDENEPNEQAKFDRPSEREHLFQVTDIFTNEDEMGKKLNLPDNSVSVKYEVVEGSESGRTLLHRLTLDDQHKGFFATRIFLKALGQDYKGNITIDTDLWCGLQFYATVIHNGTYANIDKFNFDKKIDQVKKSIPSPEVLDPKDIAW